MNLVYNHIISKRWSILYITVGVCFALLLIQKMLFTLLFNEKEMHSIIQNIFEKNFNKAIQFDDITVTLGGNLKLKNIKIAPTTDFNDNYNLISSKKTIIDLNYFKAITGRIHINGIKFYDSSITIVKNYGKSYKEIFDHISTNVATNAKYISYEDFYIKAMGNCIYNENFSNDKLKINIGDVCISISMDDTTFRYHIKGKVKPLDDRLDEGKIKFSGYVYFSDKMKYQSSSHEIYIKKLDMSVANYFIKDYSDLSLSIRGYFYTNAMIKHDNTYSIKGSVDFDNITIENTGVLPHYMIVSNDNVSIKSSMKINNDLSHVIIDYVSFNDNEIDINASLQFLKDKYFNIAVTTNTIDLDDIDYLQIIPDVYGDGTFALDIQCDYDLSHNEMRSFKIYCDAEDIAIFSKTKNNAMTYIKDSWLKINGDIKKININACAKHQKSDVMLRSTINIEKWVPFTSTDEIMVQSKRLSAELLSKLLLKGIKELYSKAAEDLSIGYNEIYFRQKPLGKYLSNNIINTKINVDTLTFEKNAHLKNINIELLSNKGLVTTQSFNCEGYSANYNFSVNAFCNSDYPTMTISCAVNNFDYGTFLRDTGLKDATGLMNMNLNYGVSGYRLSHLLQNGNGNFTLNIANSVLNSSMIQRKIIELAKSCNIVVEGGGWHCNRIDVAINHTADRLILQSLYIDTDNASVSGYGNYSIENGLSLPCNATFYKRDGRTITTTHRASFSIKGELLRPFIVPLFPCGKEQILLFDVN